MDSDWLNSNVSQLDKLQDFCNSHNIKLYILFVPYQSSIYNEQAKQYSNVNVVKNENNAINYFKLHSQAKIIYPYNELKAESKNKLIYFKADHHWTDDGAYIGYQALMKEIQKDFPNIRTVSKKDYNITQSKKIRSDYERNFHNGEILMYQVPVLEKFSDKILDTNYNYYTHKNQKELKTEVVNIPGKKQRFMNILRVQICV